MGYPQPVERRFWPRVNKTDSCWIWTGATTRNGYGRMSVNGRQERAHRISWTLANGPIPDGRWVLHECDNGLCVNPDHLFLGTARDNTRDMMAKGRSRFGGDNRARGERSGRAKLTDEDVRAIRSVWPEMRQVDLAKRYGVSQVAISHIVLRKSWRHLSTPSFVQNC